MMEKETMRCRKCLLEETEDKNLYEKIRRTVEQMDPDVRVGEDKYRHRLEQCRQCEKLLAGMCLVCGCFVEIRAANKHSYCPGEGHFW